MSQQDSLPCPGAPDPKASMTAMLKAGGEMGRVMTARDWSDSPLGPPHTWPATLRHAVAMLLPAPAQIVLFWGPDFIALYNDAYAPTIGTKHPVALGQPAREHWAELWNDLAPLLQKVRDTGENVVAKDRRFYIERQEGGQATGEEVFFDINYSPVLQEDGSMGGVLCIVNETTQRVRQERQAQLERERLESMFAQAPSYVALLSGPTHRFDLTNAAYQRLIGHREAVGRSLTEVLPEVAGQGFVELLDRCYATGMPYVGKGTSVWLQREPDGPLEEHVLDFIFQPVRDAEGRVDGIFVEGTDVTETRAAEHARAEAEERLRVATQAASIGTWDYDVRADLLRWDTRCKALFGLPPDAPVDYQADFVGRLHPDDRAATVAAADAAMIPGSPGYDVEYRTLGADGIERWCAATGRTIFEGSEPVRFVGTIIDISARREAEAALRQSERALREEREALEILNRAAAQVAAELDLDRLVQGVVDAGRELTGAQFGAFFYNRIDASGESYMLYSLSGVSRAAFENFPMPRKTAIFAPTFEGKGIVRSDDITADSRYGHNDTYHGMPAGHLPVRSYLAAPVVSRSGEVIGGLFFGDAEVGRFDDRCERLLVGLSAQAATGIDNARLFDTARRANEALAAKVEARTQERDRVWEVSRDMLGVSDRQGIWLSVNPAWERLLGWPADAIVGRRSDHLVHPEDRERAYAHFEKLFGGESMPPIELRMQTASGDFRWLSWASVSAEDHIYASARDITEDKAQAAALESAEDALRQSQKMETLGQLTGGVAHDFNNLLQIVTGNLETLIRNLPEEKPRLRRAADNAMTGANRAATLTQRLLAFARRQPLAPKAIDSNRLVAGMSDLLQRTLGETVVIETSLVEGLWQVEADPNQLETAILNLAINARDAMTEGGTLTIETRNTLVDSNDRQERVDVPPGHYVVISVSDTGIGMDEAVLARVFEPFFTTKDVGRGTGLGLSMVYGFVKQSGGSVMIYSEPGQGTAVRIYLPRIMGAAFMEEARPPAVIPEGTRGETILVCEDDEDVRAYSVEVLSELGYHVLPAENGPATLALQAAHDGPIALLFTDVVLPGGMTGAQLAEQVKTERPEIKILFTTGYARDAIVHHGRLDPGVELITKPFGYADLAARVRALLDAG